MEYFNVGVGDIKVLADQPIGFRIACFPDGRQELHGAYPWQQGCLGGVLWKEIPRVQVDEDGVALP